jgi:predicted N-acyltransferase
MRVVHQLDQTNRPAWESLRDPGNLLSDYRYLKTIEEARVIECQPCYFEFYAGSEMICFAPAYLLANDLALYAGDPVQKVLLALRRLFPGWLKVPTLEFGSPISTGQMLSISPLAGLSQLGQAAALIIAYARTHRIGLVLLRDFVGPVRPLELAFKQNGFAEMLDFPLARMSVRWDSFEAYLAEMTDHYRSPVRRKMKLKEKQAIKTVWRRDESALDYLSDYRRLFANVRERSSEYPREYIGDPYHQAMHAFMGEDSLWLQYFKDGILAAFLHLVVYQDQLLLHYIGMDYQVSHQASLYFNALYDAIKYAIEHRLHSIDAGVTTYPAKAAAGFSILPQRMYFWHRSPLIRRFAVRGFEAFTDFGLQDCHPAFREHQEIWQGRAKRRNRIAEK